MERRAHERSVTAPPDEPGHGRDSDAPLLPTTDPVHDEPEAGSARWWAQWLASGSGRPRRRRRGGLTSERIIEAALGILRESGIEALTMRCVAERLDTTIASLYRHVASRDELIALIADRVVGEVRLERTGRGWRADIEALMRDFRRISLDQPLPPSARDRSGYGPNMLRLVDTVLGLFLDAGLTAEQAGYTTITMMELMASSAALSSLRDRGSGGARGSDGFSGLLDQFPANRLTALRTAGAAYIAAPADEVFEHSMTIFLDGVSSRLPADHDGTAPPLLVVPITISGDQLSWLRPPPAGRR